MWRRGLRFTIFACWLMSLTVAPIAEAHCFTIWRFHTPQHCSVVISMRHAIPQLQPKRLEIAEQTETFPERIGSWTQCDDYCVDWPGVEWMDAPNGDERLQALAKLRALSDGPDVDRRPRVR